MLRQAFPELKEWCKISLPGGEKLVYKCGDKPGIGTYVCNKCGEDLVLDDATDTLPPCKCNNCEFDKS